MYCGMLFFNLFHELLIIFYEFIPTCIDENALSSYLVAQCYSDVKHSLFKNLRSAKEGFKRVPLHLYVWITGLFPQESMEDAVIKATGMVEFEDALRLGPWWPNSDLFGSAYQWN